MDPRPSGEISREVNSLSELVFSEETLDSTLSRVGMIALRDLRGWDAVGATLVERNRVTTFGGTDDVVSRVDQAQYEYEEGPCVYAIKEESFQYFSSDEESSRWPSFKKDAVKAGINSVMSFPLATKDQVFGALNIYSRNPRALQAGQKETGAMFAAQAAVFLANASSYFSQTQAIEQLHDGLESRTVIGQAVGMVMEREAMTSEEAFQKLVHLSQTANMKLREIATRYVAAHEESLGGPHSA